MDERCTPGPSGSTRVRTVVFLGVNASHSHTSLAARYLCATLDPARWRSEILDATVAEDAHELLARIGALRPDVLAVSFYLFNREYLEALLPRFRAVRSDVKVVAGGPELLGPNEWLIRPPALADVGVRGEGELAFPRLLDALDRPWEWAAIPGLCFAQDGAYFETGPSADVPGPEDIPPPYARQPPAADRPFAQLETSRGCPGACAFCTSAESGPLRTLPLERVRSDLAAIRDAGLAEVRVIDRTFNAQPGRCRELLLLFRDEFPGLRFHLEIDPARLTDAEVEVLAGAAPGRFHAEAGVQTLSAAVLARIRRRGTPDQVLAGVRRLAALASVEVHADLIAGLPGGTFADVCRDVTLLCEAGPREIQLELLKALPGTALGRDPAAWGLVASPRPPYEVLRTDAMSPGDILSARRLSRTVDWFYNAPPLHAVVRGASADAPGFWPALAAFLFARDEWRSGLGLEKRFVLLRRFLGESQPDLAALLADAWVRADLGMDASICETRPWRGPLPAGSERLDGDPAAAACRILRARIAGEERLYGFAFDGRRRRLAFVVRLP